MSLEFVIPSINISLVIVMTYGESLADRLEELTELEEYNFILGFSQVVEKKCPKSWHDRKMKTKTLELGALVFMYDNKFLKSRRKLRMRWLGPLKISLIIEASAMKLNKLEEKPMKGLVNGSS